MLEPSLLQPCFHVADTHVMSHPVGAPTVNGCASQFWIHVHMHMSMCRLTVCSVLRIICTPYPRRSHGLKTACGMLFPATWKHGWSKHDSSIIPSKHSMPQDLYSLCLSLMNHARTMLTPIMFTSRRSSDRTRAPPGRARSSLCFIDICTQFN